MIVSTSQSDLTQVVACNEKSYSKTDAQIPQVEIHSFECECYIEYRANVTVLGKIDFYCQAECAEKSHFTALILV
jgi:hypothetical protein